MCSSSLEFVGMTAGGNAEPMTLGSQPGSPSSPGHGGTQFLSGYLMGDSGPTSTTNNPRGWSLPGSLSPTKNRPCSTMTPNSPSKHLFSPLSHMSTPTPRGLQQASSDKHGGPPIHGLFEHPTTPLNSSTSSALPGSRNTPALYMGTPVVNASDNLQLIKNVNQEMKIPPSPAQLDPFYLQGESLSSSDQLDECWITVFGFPPAAASYILQQFHHYGNVMDHKMSPNGNWMHIRYQTKLQAKIALSKNGKVFNGNIMVGVNPCIDKTLMNTSQHRPSLNGSDKSESTISCRSLSQPASGAASPVSLNYQYAARDHSVMSPLKVPQKSNGMISQLMDYFW